MSLLNHRLKVIPTIGKREIDTFGALPVETHKIACEEIQGSSQVVNRIADEKRNLARRCFDEAQEQAPGCMGGFSEYERRMANKLGLVLDGQTIRVLFPIGPECGLKLRDVALGPLNL
jgi:hypothetical protein